MKTIIFSFLLLLTTTVLGQRLGDFGHIKDNIEGVNHQFENETHSHKIIYKNNSFSGNTLLLLENGFATIENTCGNTPPVLRLFTEEGTLKFKQAYNQTINPKTDPTGRHIYFQNNKTTTLLNTETFSEHSIPYINITVTATGEPIYFNAKGNQLYTPTAQFKMPFTPHAIELDQLGSIYVFGRNQFAIIDNNQISYRIYKNGSFFESKTIDGQVYWVEKKHEKNKFIFKLLQVENDEDLFIDQHTLDIGGLSKPSIQKSNDGQLITCPMFPDLIDYPFPIGNSYAEHQWYGGQPYLHPGIDLMGIPQQEIYAPVDGVVKAILTTSGDLHWRLALGLEDTTEEQDGYLFAHLDPTTIPFAVGDMVSAGDYLGSIVEWPISDFHHLHFARLTHQGEIWDGNWLTKDNLLSDITNFKDESVPVFEPLWNEQTIAFRSENGVDILEPENLMGSFDIICHAHDLSNSDWRLDVDSFWFELIDLTTNEVVYQQDAFSYDFELDTYFSDINTLEILNTIYSTSLEWQTVGNYDERQFFQNVSRSNGDGVINEEDSEIYFDSSIFPDGNYLLRIHAYDAVSNHSSTEIEVTFNNEITNTYEINSELPIIYPNPNTGHFRINTNGITITKGEIYNSLGQLITNFGTIRNLEKDIMINSGPAIYYIRLFGLDNQLVVNQKVIIVD